MGAKNSEQETEEERKKRYREIQKSPKVAERELHDKTLEDKKFWGHLPKDAAALPAEYDENFPNIREKLRKKRYLQANPGMKDDKDRKY